VNNAGIGQMAPFEETTAELFDRLNRILFRGPYFLSQTLLPLIADGGAIVNTTSNAARPNGVDSGYSAYASMKAALTTCSRYLAKELGTARGIRVNSIAPGPTRTRLGRDYFERFPDEVVAPMAERTVLGRIGEPDDIGKAIAALLSDDCAWITGEDIEVSGGYRL
jgi:NAD(P)-dependent dehydrogenase (short-subunit alcohol dehydrogenase family)